MADGGKFRLAIKSSSRRHHLVVSNCFSNKCCPRWIFYSRSTLKLVLMKVINIPRIFSFGRHLNNFIRAFDYWSLY